MNKGLIELVCSLNIKFYEDTNIDDLYPFTLYSSGWFTQINFMGVCVYNDDNEEREWDEETEDFTPSVEEYCIQEAKKVLESLLPILKWEK